MPTPWSSPDLPINYQKLCNGNRYILSGYIPSDKIKLVRQTFTSTTMLMIQWHGTHFINTLWAHDALHWRHNERDSVSNLQPHGSLLNRLFGRRSKKTSKLRVTGFCAGNSPGPMNSPHKGPVTRKMFPFADVIMCEKWSCYNFNCYDTRDRNYKIWITRS